jgi:hypothetical protein
MPRDGSLTPADLVGKLETNDRPMPPSVTPEEAFEADGRAFGSPGSPYTTMT